ncbi:MAG: glycosyltransferase family 4 protein [Actinobacteria bacterium]|nr:MAG: glycosyltransferase family 4 protein [Actinomycetota bacterium]
MKAPARSTDLVVLVNGFPRLSETFVLQELLELERRGLSLHVFALRRPDEVVQQEALSQLRAPVEYLPESPVAHQRLRVRLAHTALFLQRRIGYLNALADALASPEFSRSLGARSALLAHRIARLGSPPLYIHFAHKPATIGRLAALLAGVPYALSAHAKDIWLTPDDELARKVRDAEVVLTCTEDSRAHLAALAGGRTPVRLAYHGVELKDPPPSRHPGDRPRVLAVGRLVEKKGHETLLLAAAQLRDRGLEFTVRLAGEGPEWARLQRLVHEVGLGDRVAFLGPLSESELQAEYQRADVFALPCRKLANGDQDGLPNVILEAMAHGLPVVSTRLAGIVEAVVDGESGLLADQDDAAALAENLGELLQDPNLRERIGQAGRDRVAERFERSANLPRVVDALIDAGIVGASHDKRRGPLQAVA